MVLQVRSWHYLGAGEQRKFSGPQETSCPRDRLLWGRRPLRLEEPWMRRSQALPELPQYPSRCSLA